MSATRIVLCFDGQNNIERIVTNGDIEILFVCDHAPGDRVYRWTSHEVDKDALAEVLGDDRIGHRWDETGAALGQRRN